MRRWAIAAGLTFILILSAEAVRAESSPDSTQTSICLMLESAAQQSALATGQLLCPADLAGEQLQRRGRRSAHPQRRAGRKGSPSSCRAPRLSATCSTRSIRCRRCRRQQPSCVSCASASAISGLQRRPYNAGPRRLQRVAWLAPDRDAGRDAQLRPCDHRALDRRLGHRNVRWAGRRRHAGRRSDHVRS